MKWSRLAGRATLSESGSGALPPTVQVGARLEVGIAGATLHASLSTGSREGAEGTRVAGERVVDLVACERLAGDIGAILNRATRWGDVDQGSRELLRQHGELLFDMLLPAAVKASLRGLANDTAASLRQLTLVVEPSLLGLPWELMHTGEVFIGLALAVGRLARGLQAELTVTHCSAVPARTLVLCDPRGDLIGSYYEGLALRDELAQCSERFAVDLRSSEVGLGEVRRLLREYDIVHFAGHAERVAPSGTADPDGERGWWLRDGVLGPSAIAELTGGRRFPRLIFSNACRSASDGGAAGAIGAPGLARAFLEAGVEHYVGTIHDVPDEPASLFALTFYRTLLARPEAGIAEAVRAARTVLAERYGPDSVYWASWVLYGAPGNSQPEQSDVVRLEPMAPSRRTTGLPAVAARVRGASAATIAAPALPIGGMHWPSIRRAATVGLGFGGLVAVAILLTAVLGRSPPTAWTEGRGLRPVVLPAHAMVPREGPAKQAGTILEWVPADGGVAGMYRSGDHFRLRVSVPDDGFIALWRVDSAGSIRRVDAEAGPLRAVGARQLIALPDAERSYELDERSGTERFYLAWRQVPPSDPGALQAELERELGSLARFEEALDDRFDTVTRLVVEHR